MAENETGSEVVDAVTGAPTTGEAVAASVLDVIDDDGPDDIVAEDPTMAPAPEPFVPPGGVSMELQERLAHTLLDLADATREHEAAKEQAKTAKVNLDAMHVRLERVSQEVSNVLAGKVTAAPMFDENGHATPDAVAELPGRPATGTPAGELTPEQKSAPICELGLSTAINAILDTANITTVGELQARMVAKGEFWTDDIKGVGAERAEKVTEAFYHFVGWSAETGAETV